MADEHQSRVAVGESRTRVSHRTVDEQHLVVTPPLRVADRH